MRKIIYFYIIFIVLFNSCVQNSKTDFSFFHELENQTKKNVNRLIEYGEITGPFIGESGSKSEQYENFINFKKEVSEKELLFLIEHPNPVVKCYSFDVLVKKKHPDVFKILKSKLTDSSSVYTQYGCVGDRTQVNDYFIKSAIGYGPKSNYLTEKQKYILDSLILFKPNVVSEYKNHFLESTEPKKENYIRIRNLVLKGNRSAVIGLAKFQKINDFIFIDTLLRHEYYSVQEFGLKSVKNYPDKAFWNSIKNIHLTQIKKTGNFNYRLIKELYQAIVQYQNIESRKLLVLTLNDATESAMRYHKKHIWIALKKYPNTIYDGIVEKLNFSEYELKNLEYEWDNFNKYSR